MTTKQPRKKRRLDSEERCSNTVPPESIPLAQPNQVIKSSKDPNQGMYPRHKELNRMSAPSSSFSKASDLLKSGHHHTRYKGVNKVDVVDVDSSDSDTNVPEQHTPKRLRKSDSVVVANVEKTKISSKIPRLNLRSRQLLDSGKESGNKIINYFKPLPASKPKKNLELKFVKEIKKSEATSTESNNSETNSGNSKVEMNKQKKLENKNEAFFKKVHNRYGLLGDVESDEEQEGQNYFEQLPDHIIETVLCQIPMLDLLACRSVCKMWNSLISGSRFMDWKKLYYRIKMNDARALHTIKQKAQKFGLQTVNDAFAVYIKYMAEGFLRKPSNDMYDILIKNKRAADAELVLAERFPTLCKKDSKPWSIFAMTILLSETVWDIYNLYKSLCFSENSDCSLHDVTNALYCAAAFLLHFRNTLHLNYGLHYRVYYVIYMIENTLPQKGMVGTQSLRVPKGLPGQQSIHSYCDSQKSQLTYEQLRILNHCIQPGQIIKIVALAGTGKTTTLLHLSQLYPQVKFLSVVYNKAVCTEAAKRFPSNVVCKTAHSLAYSTEGSRLRSKITYKIKPHDIVTLLQHKVGTKLHVFSYAKNVLSTIESYVCSADEEISLTHVPKADSSERTIADDDRNRILRDANVIWSKMIDREDKSMKITHDVYLKLYQLSKPDLSQYNCIMVDEAQDCNPAMLAVLLSQKMPVILVGDPNQQIYGFRGAKNALQSIEATHTYYLTKSFRFGPEIAYIASSCLENLKHITTNTLVGNDKPSYVGRNVTGQYAIIARSNVVLFNEAMRICCQKRVRDHEPTTINGAFVGGIESYGFQQLLDICKLANHHTDPEYTIKDRFISKFKTYEELNSYAKNAEDSDLLSKIELVRLYSSEIPDYIKAIKEKCSHPMQLANIVFSTAHKAKGLEFDTVCLTDDYPIANWNNVRRRGSISSGSEEEEYNVIYVALTRAKTCLLIPEKLYRVFKTSNEKFEYPVLSKDVSEDGQEIKCVSCSDMFKPHTVLALYRRGMLLANGRKIAPGALCMKCRTDPKVRTRVELDPVIMYLDPTDDYAHVSMASLVGPLPNDPPIVHNNYPAFQDMDVVYIINIHV